MATEKKIPLTIDAKKAISSLKNLQKEINNLTTALTDLTKGTEAYNQKLTETVNKLSELQKAVTDIKSVCSESITKDIFGDKDPGELVNKLITDLETLKTNIDELIQKTDTSATTTENLTEKTEAATEATKEQNTETANATEEKKKLNEETEKASTTMKKLKDEVEKCTDAFLKAKKEGKNYKDEIKNLKDAQGELAKAEEVVKIATGGMNAVYDQSNKILGDVVTGFNSFKDVAAIAGVEINGLEQAIVGIQTGMKIIDSIKSLTGAIKTGISAVKMFNLALASNPIGAVIAAAAALIAIIVALGSVLGQNKKDVEAAKKEQGKYNEEVKKGAEQHDFQRRMMEAQGATQSELLQKDLEHTKAMKAHTAKRINDIQKELEIARNKTFVNKKLIKELEEAEKEALANRAKYNEEYSKNMNAIVIQNAKEAREKREQEEREQKEANEKRIAQQKQLHEKLQQDKEKFENAQKELEDKRVERALKAQKDASFDKERIQIIKDEITYNNQLIASYEKIINDPKASLEAKAKATQDLMDLEQQQIELHKEQLTEEEQLGEKQKELANILKEKETLTLEEKQKRLQEETALLLKQTENEELSYDKRIEAAQKYQAAKEELAQVEKELDDNKKEVEDFLKQQKIAKEEKEEEETLAKLEQERKIHEEELARLKREAEDTTLSYEERMKAAQAYTEHKQQLADVEEKIEAEQKKQLKSKVDATKETLNSMAEMLGENTVAGKAAAVAAATISTYQSATSAFASMSGIPVVGPALGAAAAAAAVVSGIKNVKEILSVEVPNASDTTSGSAEVPTLPSFPEATEPIMETHTNLDAYDEELINKPQKVYVSETDISAVQGRVTVSEGEATF